MDYLNLLFKSLKKVILAIFFLLSNFCYGEYDSLEKFFENRFGLYPPTEDQAKAAFAVIDSFLKKISSQNVNDAYFLNTSKTFQQATPLNDFKIFVKNFHDVNLEQLPDYHLVNFANTNHNQATLEWSAEGQNKYQQFSIYFSLVLEDNEWKISYIKIYETIKTR